MRMIEPEQVGAELRRTLLRLPIILRPDQKAPPRPFFRCVRKRESRRDYAGAAVQSTTALVGIGFGAVTANRVADARVQAQRHQRELSSQNRSDRYFSPPSQKTTTITLGR